MGLLEEHRAAPAHRWWRAHGTIIHRGIAAFASIRTESRGVRSTHTPRDNHLFSIHRDEQPGASFRVTAAIVLIVIAAASFRPSASRLSIFRDDRHFEYLPLGRIPRPCEKSA